ncbi:CinA family protein [Halobacteriales archaeon QS_8_69_26]|nr:MAG: CinA family protein [Halobacteriales archaeon QS_8_69_26]
MSSEGDAGATGPGPGAEVRALARRVGERLVDRDETLAVAESATGGALGAALTAVPGASGYFRRGAVAYGYDTKRRTLGVARETIDDHGVVSGPVAREMARGIRDGADVTWGVATTAVAGPDGGTEDRPVGTAFVAVAHAAPWETGDSYATVDRYEFDGDRAAVRRAVVRQSLADLLSEMAGSGSDAHDEDDGRSGR